MVHAPKKMKFTVYDFAGDVFPCRWRTISPKQGSFESGRKGDHKRQFLQWHSILKLEVALFQNKYSLFNYNNIGYRGYRVLKKRYGWLNGCSDDIDKVPETVCRAKPVKMLMRCFGKVRRFWWRFLYWWCGPMCRYARGAGNGDNGSCSGKSKGTRMEME